MRDNRTLQEKKNRRSLTFIFSLFVFLILFIAIAIAAGAVFIIEAVMGREAPIDTWLILVLMTGISAIMGYSFSLLLSKFPLRPINDLVNGMNRLASGDFSARLEYKGITLKIAAFREVSESFNRMAEELGNIELLRSDFINSFSHEFKTPIVSIAGFAKLLRSEDLGDEERCHYLSIIEEESLRLASLATNILNLSRLESQSILTDVTEYNLSEQIRSALLVLESKWGTKGIIPILLPDEEISISGNEELLKQVWINLLDNAIKFSPEGREIVVNIEPHTSLITVHITNEGDEIPEDARDKIFNKFYQADESRSGDGSGVGLAVVKRIVELHRGHVSYESKDGKTTFRITLPR